VPPPTKVWLRGTTPSGDLLELEIPVQHSGSGAGDKTIHQLAARKVLGELKDGTSYLHNKYKSITGDIRERGFEELVKREGVRVGLKYGVASEWTSFVAVVKREEDVQQQQEREREGAEGGGECGLDGGREAYDFIDVDAEKDSDSEDPRLRQIPAPGAGKLFLTPLMTDITNNSYSSSNPKARRNAPVPQQPTGPAAPANDDNDIATTPHQSPIPQALDAKLPECLFQRPEDTRAKLGWYGERAKGRMDDLSEPPLSRFRSIGAPLARSDIPPYTLSNVLPAEHLSFL
jgi:hypothetical protein